MCVLALPRVKDPCLSVRAAAGPGPAVTMGPGQELSDIVGVDYEIIYNDQWYHSWMVLKVYHVKYFRCYIIEKD